MATNNAINANQTLDTAATPTFGTITLSSSTATQLSLNCTVAHASAGPIADFYHNSTSSNADTLGEIDFNGNSSTGVKRLYAFIQCGIGSNTNAAENGNFAVGCLSSGASQTVISASNTGCRIRATNTNTAVPQFFIGRVVESKIGSGSGVALSTATAANVTSISIDPGNWMIYGIAVYSGITTGTQTNCTITTTSATLGTGGDTNAQSPTIPTAGADSSVTLPGVYLSVAVTTTVYLVARATFTVSSSPIAYGRITAHMLG